MERIGNRIPEDVPVPSGFQIVGHVALLQIHDGLGEFARLIAEATMEFDHRIRSVAVKTDPTIGIMRKPGYRLVAGDSNTVTEHVEGGVLFRLDPLRLIFSGGNVTERMRLSNMIEGDEMVLDMFACVGQFSLHIAKRTKARVVAIEINPEAHRFLVENIQLNGVEDRMQALLGDCRKMHPINEASRVILGYLHNTIEYLPYALRSLSEDGGYVHLHAALPKRTIQSVGNTINTTAKALGFDTAFSVREVKHYSPGIEHYVFDIHATPIRT
ncbi:MAG: class I SAM-dependent methyltransferase family protein [Candidatus Thorarchaeota archaeon]